MNHTEERKKFRTLLAGNKCLMPASVFDGLSARIAESIGYEVGLLAGSIVSSMSLAAPDMLLHTLTECADQIRRIKRVSKLCLYLDADNGFGNALNVMRTVQECEHSGITGLSIEDTTGPLAFGQSDTGLRLVSIEEGVGKMRAALAARSDPSLVIAARTPSLKLEGIESAVARAKAYAATGVDVIHLTGTIGKPEYLKAVYDVAKLPMVVGASHGIGSREELAACGVRLAFAGHHPQIPVIAKALHDTYLHLYKGGNAADLKAKSATPEEMDRYLNDASYMQAIRDYLH